MKTKIVSLVVVMLLIIGVTANAAQTNFGVAEVKLRASVTNLGVHIKKTMEKWSEETKGKTDGNEIVALANTALQSIVSGISNLVNEIKTSDAKNATKEQILTGLKVTLAHASQMKETLNKDQSRIEQHNNISSALDISIKRTRAAIEAVLEMYKPLKIQ